VIRHLRRKIADRRFDRATRRYEQSHQQVKIVLSLDGREMGRQIVAAQKLSRATNAALAPPKHYQLKRYRTPEQIAARILVLRAKADRIVAYNATRDATVLDAKQLRIMAERGRVAGRDAFPPGVLFSIGKTIDILYSRLKQIYVTEACRYVITVDSREVA
jgi:hypothetical protein